MSTEQIADGCSGHAFATGLLKSQHDIVGNRVAQQLAENPSGRRLAIFPDGDCRCEVGYINSFLLVDQRIDEREANCLRLRPSRNRPEQAGLLGGQVGINCFPLLTRSICHRDAANTFGERDRCLHELGQPVRLGIIQIATVRKQFGAAY